jgi:hypothetical protein
VSYGTYQLSSNAGTLQRFMDTTKWGKELEGLQINSPAFQTRWKELAQSPEFAVSQHEFMKKTHYDPMAKEAQALGVDTSDRSIQEALWSVGTQHGVGGGSNLLRNALKGQDVASMGREGILNAIYGERAREGAGGKLAYFQKSSSDWQPGLRKRFEGEREKLLAMEPGQGVTATEIAQANVAKEKPTRPYDQSDIATVPDQKVVTINDSQPKPMLVSQAITAPKTQAEKIQEITPKARQQATAIEKDTQNNSQAQNVYQQQGSTDSNKMFKLLEQFAAQDKPKPTREGRFRKPDSVIPQEFDDTILTLMAHDRM